MSIPLLRFIKLIKDIQFLPFSFFLSILLLCFNDDSFLLLLTQLTKRGTFFSKIKEMLRPFQIKGSISGPH